MALSPEPPPHYPNAPGPATRWPDQPLPAGSDWITTSVFGPGFDILGRDGHPAPDEIIEIITTIFWNFPYQDPNGSWCWMGGGQYLGRGGDRWDRNAIVLFELRTPAEVAAVLGGADGPSPFAVTLFGESLLGGGPVPPADGVSHFNGVPYAPADWPNQRFHRILIRDDLFTGGAGARWAGRDFFAETCLHEMGHIAQNYLIELYGEDYVKFNTCALFGQPAEKWNDPSDAWADRVIEASAEVYKDISLPTRRYDNRTNYQLAHSEFHDFLKLYVDYFENPFWDYGNDRAASYHYDFFLQAVQSGTQPAWLFMPDYHIPPTGVTPDLWKVFAWDPKIGDNIRFHWNLLADGDTDWGDNFVDAFGEPMSPETAAQISAKAKIGIAYWHVPYWGHFPGDFDPAWFIRMDQVELNPVRNNYSGVIELDTTGMPPDGFVAELVFPGTGPWEYPRFDAPPHIDEPQLGGTISIGFPNPIPAGQPWAEWIGGIKRARYMIRDITWPYAITPSTDITGELKIGPGKVGVALL